MGVPLGNVSVWKSRFAKVFESPVKKHEHLLDGSSPKLSTPRIQYANNK
jgi:hypothetical protein